MKTGRLTFDERENVVVKKVKLTVNNCCLKYDNQ